MSRMFSKTKNQMDSPEEKILTEPSINRDMGIPPIPDPFSLPILPTEENKVRNICGWQSSVTDTHSMTEV